MFFYVNWILCLCYSFFCSWHYFLGFLRANQGVSMWYRGGYTFFPFTVDFLFPPSPTIYLPDSGADPGFQVRGAHLKKLRRAEGGAKFFGGISCEKLRFYAKKSYFFQLPREARKFLGYFVWKITILRQKIIFIPILGGARRVRPSTPA